jgi:hypothetical protein
MRRWRMQTGDKVRVKAGVVDPDFPDIEIGGWSGMITAFDDTGFQVQWDNETLRNMSDGIIEACEAAGLSWHVMWLRRMDLEPADD